MCVSDHRSGGGSPLTRPFLAEECAPTASRRLISSRGLSVPSVANIPPWITSATCHLRFRESHSGLPFRPTRPDKESFTVVCMKFQISAVSSKAGDGDKKVTSFLGLPATKVLERGPEIPVDSSVTLITTLPVRWDRRSARLTGANELINTRMPSFRTQNRDYRSEGPRRYEKERNCRELFVSSTLVLLGLSRFRITITPYR